jgi:hypothetical protein
MIHEKTCCILYFPFLIGRMSHMRRGVGIGGIKKNKEISSKMKETVGSELSSFQMESV